MLWKEPPTHLRPCIVGSCVARHRHCDAALFDEVRFGPASTMGTVDKRDTTGHCEATEEGTMVKTGMYGIKIQEKRREEQKTKREMVFLRVCIPSQR